MINRTVTSPKELEDERISLVHEHLMGSAATTRKAAETCSAAVVEAASVITQCFSSGNKLLICGNGGSAADAQHISSELLNRLRPNVERPGLPAIALTTDTSFLTAYANDCGYEGVFERQIIALGRAGDVLLAISTSGNSANVIRAADAARERGMITIGLVGEHGRLIGVVDRAVIIPSNDTQHIQESMLAIEHIMCLLIETALFGETEKA